MNINNIYENLIEDGLNVKKNNISYLLEFLFSTKSESVESDFIKESRNRLIEYRQQFLPISNELNLLLSNVFRNEENLILEFFDFIDIKQTKQIEVNLFEECIINQLQLQNLLNIRNSISPKYWGNLKI